jgi:hypothetical protein
MSRLSPPPRGIWLGGAIGLTGAAYVVAIALAPPAQAQPVRAVQWSSHRSLSGGRATRRSGLPAA